MDLAPSHGGLTWGSEASTEVENIANAEVEKIASAELVGKAAIERANKVVTELAKPKNGSLGELGDNLEHMFIWGLLLLCMTVLLLQITPWVLNVSRIFLDWWSFRVSDHDIQEDRSQQAWRFREVFSSRAGRALLCCNNFRHGVWSGKGFTHACPIVAGNWILLAARPTD
jgi:hypothetical protein